MRKYGLLRASFMAFFSKALYRDVAMHWRGAGIGYLFLLLAVCWVPDIVRLHLQFMDFCRNDAPELISQTPTITITDGAASIVEPEPYYIDDPDTGERVAVVDTTGSIATPDDANVRVLLKKTEIMFKKNDVETRTFSLKEIKDFSLNKETVAEWMQVLRMFGVPVLYVLLVPGSFVFRCVQALLYACAGMLLVHLYKSNSSYLVVYRLTVISLTPCIVVKTILSLASITIPWAGLWYMFVTIGYLFFAVRSASLKENIESEPSESSESASAR